jgi:hypothetical protein
MSVAGEWGDVDPLTELVLELDMLPRVDMGLLLNLAKKDAIRAFSSDSVV